MTQNKLNRNPWVPLGEDNPRDKGIMSLLQLLLMGYGAYCLIVGTTKKVQKYFGKKELPVHDS